MFIDHMPIKHKELIARWESVSGKYWLDLYLDSGGATYKAADAGGCLGPMSREEAIAYMEHRVNNFQPDKNKTPMRRIR